MESIEELLEIAEQVLSSPELSELQLLISQVNPQVLLNYINVHSHYEEI